MDYSLKYDEYLIKLQADLPNIAGPCFNEGSDVAKAAIYSLLAGGKRIRGVLCMAVCDMLDGNVDAATSCACACEMLHCYSLIHDDLPCMDDDDLRRGKPSCHKVYGEATALLAGDALLTGAFEVISAANATNKQKAQAVLTLASAAGAKGMIYGQELDLAAEHKAISAQELELVHKNKTGMLINAAVQLGGICADTSEVQKKALNEYAFNIGLAFQIIDDVLDVTSSSEALGKPVGSDKINGKNTFVSINGIKESILYAKALTQKACDSLDDVFLCDTSFLREFAQELSRRTK